MSLISRYQKPGGFLQLLQLLETCDLQKQEKFLRIIESEDLKWSRAIRQKMITIEKILTWKNGVLAQIAEHVPETILGAIYHQMPNEGARLLSAMPSQRVVKIQSLFNVNPPTAKQVAVAMGRLIEVTRSLVSDGTLYADRFAPEVMVPSDIEMRLAIGDFSFDAPAAKAKNTFDDDEIGDINIIMPESSRTRKVPSSVLEETAKPVSMVVPPVVSQVVVAPVVVSPPIVTPVVAPVLKVVETPAKTLAAEASADSLKVEMLQALVAQLKIDNQKLRDDVQALQERLEAIRKIA